MPGFFVVRIVWERLRRLRLRTPIRTAAPSRCQQNSTG